MKYIHYDGSAIMTGDLIAEAVADYAAVLGANNRTDTLHVPSVGADGSLTTTMVLIGPASEIVVNEAPEDEIEPEDPAFIRRLRAAADDAGPARPVDGDTHERFAGADDDAPADD